MNKLLLTLILLILAAFSFGDTGLLASSGGGVTLMQSADINLDSEVVDILVGQLDKTKYLDVFSDYNTSAVFVNGVFNLHNNSNKDQKILVGFPESKSSYNGGSLKKFIVQVDGKQLAITIKPAVKELLSNNKKRTEPDFEYSRWFTWKMTIRANSTSVVKLSYQSPLSVFAVYSCDLKRFSENSQGAAWMVNYILKTGAKWSGNIHSATISIKGNIFPLLSDQMSPAASAEIANSYQLLDYKIKDQILDRNQFYTIGKGGVYENGKFVWHLTDFKPTEDVGLIACVSDNFKDTNARLMSKNMVTNHPEDPWSREALLMSADMFALSIKYKKDKLKEFNETIALINKYSSIQYPTDPKKYIEFRYKQKGSVPKNNHAGK